MPLSDTETEYASERSTEHEYASGKYRVRVCLSAVQSQSKPLSSTESEYATGQCRV